MSIGQRIRERRLAKGLTQQQLADLVPLSSQVIVSGYECGRNVPRVRDLARIARVLECTVDELIPPELVL